jgi:DNA mismatch repair protein MutS
LNPVYDLERLIGRIVYKTANPRDFIAFKSSLSMLPYIKSLLQDFSSPLLGEIEEELDPLEDLFTLIDEAIIEEPPLAIKEGGIIKDGYREDIDKYRQCGHVGSFCHRWQASCSRNGDYVELLSS